MRVARTDPPSSVVQLRVAELAARPPTQKRLGDARIETLGPY